MEIRWNSKPFTVPVPSKFSRVVAVLNWEVSYGFVKQTSSTGLDPEFGKE